MPAQVRRLWTILAALSAFSTASALAAPSAKYCPTSMPPASQLDPVVLIGSAEGTYFEGLAKQMVFCGWENAKIFRYYHQPEDCVEDEAALVKTFIDGVLAQTGASRVDALGFSLGGVLVRHWISFLGGSSKVREVVLWGAPNHGSPFTDDDEPYCWMEDIQEDTDYVACLNGELAGCGNNFTVPAPLAAAPGSATSAGIVYYNLYSSQDLFLFPRNSILEGAVNLDLPNTIHTDLGKKPEVFRLSMLGFLRRPASVSPGYSGCGTVTGEGGGAAWAWMALVPAAMVVRRRRA